MVSNNIFKRIETLQPNIATELERMTQLAHEAADAQLLALCTVYIDAALHLEDWVPPQRPLTEKEQAFIAFTEQFVSSAFRLQLVLVSP